MVSFFSSHICCVNLTCGSEDDGLSLYDIKCACFHRNFSPNGSPDLFVELSLMTLGLHAPVFIGTSLKSRSSPDLFVEFPHITSGLRYSCLRPDVISLVNVLAACASLRKFRIGKEVHCCSIRRGLIEDVFVGNDLDVVSWNAMVTGYSQIGQFDDALGLLKRMRNEEIELNVVAWSAVIAGYAQRGMGCQALDVFREMMHSGAEPNVVTLVSVLSGCAAVAALRQGKETHCYSIKGILNVDEHDPGEYMMVVNGLIDMYANLCLPRRTKVCRQVHAYVLRNHMYVKFGDIDAIRVVFDSMKERNIVSWTSVRTGYGMHGHGEEALQIFEGIRRTSYAIDGATFLVVLYACSHSGMVDLGISYFKNMSKDFGVIPGVEHYACMVDLLGRAGRLIWVALLGACRLHSNVDLGEYAATKLSELESENDGTYRLLSNIYASVGRWKDVARIRSLMKKSGIKKRPGYSWVQGNKSTAMIYVGDRSHPISNDIYNLLADLIDRIKVLGNVPETSYALYDVDDEEKGDLLFEHSEKFALAYGLLTTTPGVPIRIIKNLRVCGDCHTAMTYISKIVPHEIILRDSSRFHLIKNGSCTCKGYW
ncbi:hypothetical protein LIER_10298 [Lithospermum erythrorhizon]|uniref:DYW domain-containing protein n=1 Tax=Lithospermum erythrorhizon TaxID=34254 RepID=A0AAV3PLN1_LITER